MAIIELNRRNWGARTGLPRRGHLIGAAKRTEVFVHHTVIVDGDASLNEWDDLADVRATMQRLQTSRPDLGMDVPYSTVAFCMASGDLVLCEGRGLDRTGAHTFGHNRSALGVAFQGNFTRRPLPRTLDEQLILLGDWLRGLRRDRGFTQLGTVRPPGRQVWAHRDILSTLCPGEHLYERLERIRFIEEEDENMMDKATWKKVQRGLQSLDPPLYAEKPIDGTPGSNTNRAVKAFERRIGLTPHGVMGRPDDPTSGMWPATREILFASVFAPLHDHEHKTEVTVGRAPVTTVRVGKVKK